MNKIRTSFWLGPVISGVLAFIAVCEINFWCSWICYVPLFISIANGSPKKTFSKGLVFGGVIALLAFYWMIPGAKRFTGYSMLYGLGVMVLSLIFLSLYHGIVLWCFCKLRKKHDARGSLLLNTLLIASLICVAEAMLMLVSESLPWFDEHAGSGLAGNLYSIQPASLFGIHVLSFVVVLVNYLLAHVLESRSFRRLWIPASVFAGYMLMGWLLLTSFSPAKTKEFTVAILAQNTLPEIRWDESTGDMQVQKIIELNRSAVTLRPDLILWSESGIPWNYEKDDELVKEVVKITHPCGASHVLGINTAYRENEIFNSAYCVSANGEVLSRYDKQRLLAFIERPINGMVVPFSSSNGITERTDAAHAAPLNTPFGKAGILICNESSVASAAASMAKQGAQFLLNMSNDGWFNNTYIVRDHFYTARLRAVESRKDLVINSNNGYSGLIKASGDIVEMKRSEEPFVDLVSVQANSHSTLATSFPMLFVYICALLILVITAINRYQHYTTRTKN